MRIIGLGSSDNRGSNWWRLTSPLRALKNAGAETTILTADTINLTDIGSDSIVVMSNVLGYTEDFYGFVDRLHEIGCTVIYDMDDDYVSKDVAKDFLFDAGLKTPPPHIDLVRACIRKCDGVTVSTPYLKNLLAPITDSPVIVVPNAVDNSWVDTWNRSKYPKSVGWVGSHRPRYEFTNLAKAWGILAQKFPELSFVVIGWKPTILVEAVSEDRFIYLPWADINEYPEVISNIDIGCLPMSSAPFNQAKSYIKALEFGARGIPVVANPTIYGNIICHGKNGYLASSVDEWVYYLSTLINSVSVYNIRAQALNQDVRDKHLMSNNVLNWAHAYSDIQGLSNIEKAIHK